MITIMIMDTITATPSIILTVRIMLITILMLTPMIRMFILTIQTILQTIIPIPLLPPASRNALENSL